MKQLECLYVSHAKLIDTEVSLPESLFEFSVTLGSFDAGKLCSQSRLQYVQIRNTKVDGQLQQIADLDSLKGLVLENLKNINLPVFQPMSKLETLTIAGMKAVSELDSLGNLNRLKKLCIENMPHFNKNSFGDLEVLRSLDRFCVYLGPSKKLHAVHQWLEELVQNVHIGRDIGNTYWPLTSAYVGGNTASANNRSSMKKASPWSNSEFGVQRPE
ncbi:hypothetical protein [Rubripirellula obstinata]|nr:hypothetical protein [Rubripirellula obstinata]